MRYCYSFQPEPGKYFVFELGTGRTIRKDLDIVTAKTISANMEEKATDELGKLQRNAA